ncbi:glycosyl hydrolase family 65 central catalytic domain-containing protein [Halenospora varia]|nr:glycosyl hydrolase family 65 central catalytic domain-containing protein [Halenospora varia]
MAKRAEVNPISQKFDTIAEPGMPGNVNFNVVATQNLSSWDDQSLSLVVDGNKLPRYLQGIYIGAAASFMGPFFEQDRNQTNAGGIVKEGWPLFNQRQAFATVSGFYDCQDTTPGTNYPELQKRGCESVISGIPHPLALNLRVENQTLDATVDNNTISNFNEVLSFKDGTTKWTYTWSPKDVNASFDIEYITFASRVRPNVAATQLRITPHGENITASVIDSFDGRSAMRSFLGEKSLYDNSTSMYVSNHPDGLPETTTWTISSADVSNGFTDEASRREATISDDNNMSIGQEWDVKCVDGETAIFEKFVGVASTDKFDDPHQTALDSSKAALKDGWDLLLDEHTTAWNSLMTPNLMTNYRNPSTGHLPSGPNIEHLQIGAVTDRYYMLQNLLPSSNSSLNLNTEGLAVGGLTSDTYGGLKFWDQDFWMYPSILLTSPSHARQILNYRVKLLEQAKSNAQEDYVQQIYKFPNGSALYPWTSGRYGNATGTGPVINYEFHLNTDIALAAFQYLAITGDEQFFSKNLYPVVLGTAQSSATILQKNTSTGKYGIHNVTDPDEYANNVDSAAFTLGSISEILDLTTKYQAEHNLTVNKTWQEMSRNIALPTGLNGITLEYQDMPSNISVKQADVVLLAHPLNLHLNSYSSNLTQVRKDLKFYESHQTPDGPAMTSAIYAILQAQYDSLKKAFDLDLGSRVPNWRGPWYQLSEQSDDDSNANGGVNPAFPFLTGHGGNAQIVPFGYLGLKLLEGKFTIRPRLPEEIEHLGIQEFWYGGNRMEAWMNETHTMLTRRGGAEEEGMRDRYQGGPMPVVVQRINEDTDTITETEYSVGVNETIVVGNDIRTSSTTTSSPSPTPTVLHARSLSSPSPTTLLTTTSSLSLSSPTSAARKPTPIPTSNPCKKNFWHQSAFPKKKRLYQEAWDAVTGLVTWIEQESVPKTCKCDWEMERCIG